MSKIGTSLEKLYTKHRIVVWYDPEQAFTEEVEELKLKDVTCITVNGDEFAVKYRVLVQQKQDKFLLYIPSARPEDDSNWLLDIDLSQKMFHTSRESLLLADLELPFHLQNWIKTNLVFFNSKVRTTRFHKLVAKSDNETVLNLKLIQVLMGADQCEVDVLMRTYVAALKNDKATDLAEELNKFNLSTCFWEEVHYKYGIKNESHNVYDFLLELFKSAFKATSSQDKPLPAAQVTLSNWQDLQSFSENFAWLSKKIATDLDIPEKLKKMVLEDLLDDDLYECIEKQILRDLVGKVTQRTFGISQIEDILKRREGKYWYGKYKDFYDAIYNATMLFQTIDHTLIQPFSNLERGIDLYTSAYYKVDQYYRLFICIMKKLSGSEVLNPIYNEVIKIYSNKWLLNLSEPWQKSIEAAPSWYLGNKSLFNFYNTHVKENHINKGRKVFVIISDAMRFEIGEQLNRMLNQQNRFESHLDYMVTGLPSYTQLGMAAMLPHTSITLGDTDDIYIDGLSTKGSVPRARVLKECGGIRATAIKASELESYKVKSDEARTLVQNHDVVYVYQNTIDKIGDDKTTEENVFGAVEEDLERLVSLITRISSINITHILITADHGFIYQDEALHESEFADAELQGTVAKSNRRFAIGTGLKHSDALFKFKACDLKIDTDAEVLIAKGITRLRRQGAGSRFVHGGASLQEVVVPVLQVTKRRKDTLSEVEVDIINSSNKRITTNIHPIRFYQKEPVTAHRLGVKLKAYFAIGNDEDKEVISDVLIHTFDSDDKQTQDRELKHNFKISTTLQKHDEVYLYLDKEIEGSTTWENYTRFPFTLTLGMMNDFDDF